MPLYGTIGCVINSILKGLCTILDSTYLHNPGAVNAKLIYVNNLKFNDKFICFFKLSSILYYQTVLMAAFLEVEWVSLWEVIVKEDTTYEL